MNAGIKLSIPQKAQVWWCYLTIMPITGIHAIMWGKGLESHPKPDCRSNGPHRYASSHYLRNSKDVMYQTCRRCGYQKYFKPELKDGRIVEMPIQKDEISEVCYQKR